MVMNPYFVCFSAYAALILPLTLRFRVRLGGQAGYRLRLQAAGLPFVFRHAPEDKRDERPFPRREMAQALAHPDMALLRAALNGRVLSRALRGLEWRELDLYARFSFPDAAQTALWYGGTRTALRALNAAGALPPVLRWRLRADFSGQGTEAVVLGIVSFRLGSLLPVAAAFARAWLRERARAERLGPEGRPPFPGVSAAAADQSYGSRE